MPGQSDPDPALIEIVTLFLGLVTGPQPVEIAAGTEVASVEIRLDGQTVGRLDAPLRQTEIDLGEALAPHDLVVVALDGEGRELGRDRRWINIDLPEVEIGGRAPPRGLTPLPIVLSGEREPTSEGMAGWFLDGGEPVPVAAVESGPAEVVVVQHPATRRHLEQMARLYLAYRLNHLGFPAVPSSAASPDWHPDLLRLEGKEFRRAAATAFAARGRAPEGRQLRQLWQSYHQLAALGESTAMRFISPLAASVSHTERQRRLFPRSARVTDAGLFWVAEKLPPISFTYRVADAVAIAGREAHAGGRRRAVLLLLEGETTDDGLYDAAAVREYLRALRVPLFVWTLKPTDELPGWGEPRFVGLQTQQRSTRSGALGESFERLAAAAAELRRAVGGQRIVWLGGERLPHRIEIDSGAGARPAGLGALTSDHGAAAGGGD